ncbi:hypothetical protein ACFL6E_01220 [Candidatus Neomarinimicrobiota bacterium]
MNDLTVVVDTIMVPGSLADPDTVAIKDTQVVQDTSIAQSVVAAEDTLVTQDPVAVQASVMSVDSLVVKDTIAIQDSVAVSETGTSDVSLVNRLFHEPPAKGILNDRPFQVYLFVNLDSSQVINVSLNLKNDLSQVYHEYSMSGAYGRFGYRLPVEDLAGSQLDYYFLIELEDYGLLAYPQDELGVYTPFEMPLVPPTQEYFQRP